MRGIYNTATGAISLTGIQFKKAFMEQVPLFYMVFGIQVVLEQWTLIPTK
jgi:hypothetical protein